MTRADHVIEAAADRLERFVADARRAGGVRAKIGDALADDPDFIRKLKPTLIARRARGHAPVADGDGARPQAPAPPPPEARPRQQAAPARSGRSGGVSPWLVVGAALVAGVVAAKVIDWRSHAHPRD
jgi:hypothetical protein